MGGTYFDSGAYSARATMRSSLGKSAFEYDDSIRSGATAAQCHKDLNPFGVNRESRDSAAHPVTVPIGISMDLTGSMQGVPRIFQEKLMKLMGHFLEGKASGKDYLGNGYPAICVAGHDDYGPMRGVQGTVQVGQFESGIEIEDELGKIWFTGNGGGNEGESYDLMLYFFARHTQHDHWDKRGKKGYLFLFGDEPLFMQVRKSEVFALFGDSIQADIPVAQIIAEVKERYQLFYVIPKMTSNWNNKRNQDLWKGLIGAENVLSLEDPNKICDLIASTVAIFEGNVDIDDLKADGLADGIEHSLVPIAKQSSSVSRYDASNLPAIGGSAAGTERL
jgi:hypothetical protein